MARTTSRQEAGPGSGDQLLTVRRAVAILDYLQQQSAPASLKTVAEALGQSPTATLRLLNTLESTGLVQRSDAPRGYVLGWKIEVLANSHLQHLSHSAAIRDAVRHLSRETTQTAAVHMASGMFSICVASEEGGQALVHRIPVGRTASLARGAAGKVILAFSDRLDLAAVIRAGEQAQSGPKGRTDQQALEAELAAVRATGFAFSSEELVADVSSVAAPIWAGAAAKVIGSVSLSGASFRWTRADMAPHLASLSQHADTISQEFNR